VSPNPYYENEFAGVEHRRAEAAQSASEFRRVERGFDQLHSDLRDQVQDLIDDTALPLTVQITAHLLPDMDPDNPDPYPDPLQWPTHPDGAQFLNGMGEPKTLVATVFRGDSALTLEQHSVLVYAWKKNGSAFVPAAGGPATLRYVTITAADLDADRVDVFHCDIDVDLR